MTDVPTLHGAARLSDWGVLRARGADAAKFLQSQLTNDIVQLGGSEAGLAAYCSPKGRMLASFVVWKASDDEILLACHASVLPPTLKRLSMFVLRAQCRLTDASAELPLWGLAGEAASRLAQDLPPWGSRVADDGHHVIRLPEAAGTPRVLLASPETPANRSDLSIDDWHWLWVKSGVAFIEAATVEKFVPQMVNFEIVGGVDFRKGCYPGQEIVARSQYRGTVKRRLFLFDVATEARAGQEVFSEADPEQPAGLVANAAPHPDGRGSSALVEIKLAALDAGSLRLGTADGPRLERRELPYPVPIAADETA